MSDYNIIMHYIEFHFKQNHFISNYRLQMLGLCLLGPEPSLVHLYFDPFILNISHKIYS
ncbi:hypothetical protein HanIR_Chr17g0875371 [Helianthus annuus]|nr:hypothetical protein HanIR_Chr17g0875371 [Helianthus annuus]